MAKDISDLERQRQENIRRNQELLRQLELEGMGENMAQDVRKTSSKPPSKSTNSKKKSPSVKKEPETPSEPRRKSRRLEGKGAELNIIGDNDTEVKQEYEYDPIKEEKERERDRKEGEMKMKDIIKKGDWESAIGILSSFGRKVSQGDYFHVTEEADEETGGTKTDIKRAREELSGLDLFEKFDPSGLKITKERIFHMQFHPAEDKKLIMAGDKVGELGLWDADAVKVKSEGDDEDGELEGPEMYAFKPHSRTISKILTDPNSSQKIYTGSYDGSIRCLDLTSFSSTEAFIFDSDPRDPIGISDFSMPDQNTIYYSTLQGEFGIRDLREPDEVSKRKIYRLHDKKIGGFGVNPKAAHQCVTASLDRTFKIWDLRKVDKNPDYEDDDVYTPHLYGHYDSRLSVSCADWNQSGDIVVNGYDDRINVFHFPDAAKAWDTSTQFGDPFKPAVTLKHNCQTGRWVSILKSRWHQNPKDKLEKFVIANMNRFIDVYSADGQQLAHLGHDSMSAVPAVCTFHPTQNWIVGGSASGKAYLWF